MQQKILIDANAILRYLLQDDEQMSLIAQQIVERGAYTLPEVLAEVIYVLQKVYHVERTDISSSLEKILHDINFERSDIIAITVRNFKNTSLDFVDCILAAYHEIDGVEVFTFDKKLNSYMERGNI